MENNSNPPLRPLSAKRKKILDNAFKQLRKARSEIDVGVLNKIRDMIAGNPTIMKGLGVKTAPKPIAEKKPDIMPDIMIVPVKGTVIEREAVDQAKTMEVMAKLMVLKPAGKEKIISVIKKAVE